MMANAVEPTITDPMPTSYMEIGKFSTDMLRQPYVKQHIITMINAFIAAFPRAAS